PLTKSITGTFVARSSSRTASSTTVRNTSGATSPSIAASRSARTSRASSTVRTKGTSRRSKGTEGNCSSRALPMVSALMPVESEMKNTGTAVGEGLPAAEGSGGGIGRSAVTGAPCSGPDAGASGTRRCAGVTVAGRSSRRGEGGTPHPHGERDQRGGLSPEHDRAGAHLGVRIPTRKSSEAGRRSQLPKRALRRRAALRGGEEGQHVPGADGEVELLGQLQLGEVPHLPARLGVVRAGDLDEVRVQVHARHRVPGAGEVAADAPAAAAGVEDPGSA